MASIAICSRSTQNLRARLLAEFDKKIDGFKTIRETYADGMAKQEAIQLGESFVSSLGGKQDDIFRIVKNMTKAQRNLFEMGAAKRLRDDILNGQRGVIQALSRSGSKMQILRAFGEKRGRRLVDVLSRERATLETFNSALAGSRTTPLAGDIADLAQGVASASQGNLRQLGQQMMVRLGQRIGEKRAHELAKMLTEDDPTKVRELINQLEAVAQSMNQPRAASIAAPAGVVNALEGRRGSREGRERRNALMPATP